MAYLTEAEFRSNTLAEYCIGCDLDTDEATAAQVTAAIARLSLRIDEACNDRFESFAATYELDGGAGRKLRLPQRCTAVTTVKTRDWAGTLTTQASTVYRLRSSLDSTGSRSVGDLDYLEIIEGQTLSQTTEYVSLASWASTASSSYWPEGEQTVEVAGTFGWTVTPADIKRAVALLVWAHFKGIDPTRRQAQSWQTPDASYQRSSGSFGMPEVDEIVTRYFRDVAVFV